MTMMISFITLVTFITIAYAIKEYFSKTSDAFVNENNEELATKEITMKELHITVASFDEWCEEHHDVYPTSENRYCEDEVDIICRNLAYDQQNSRQYMQMLEIAEELDFKWHKISLFAESAVAEKSAVAAEEAEAEAEIADPCLVGHYLEYLKENEIPSFEYDPEPDLPDLEEEEKEYEEDYQEYRYNVYCKIWSDIIKALGSNIPNILSDRVLTQVCKNWKDNPTKTDIQCLLNIKGIGEKRARKIVEIIAENHGECLASISDDTIIKVESDDLPF